MKEWAYVTPQQLYQAGLVDPAKVSEDVLWELILDAQTVIEQSTRQFFNSRRLSVRLAGSNSKTLFLAVPIIKLEQLFLNESDQACDPGQYDVYNSITYPDDRRNPRIVMKSERQTIFEGRVIGAVFLKDYIQRLEGTFGFVEADGSTPLPIIRALKKIVMKAVQSGQGTVAWQAGATGPIKQEVTDGHSITYAVSDVVSNSGMGALTGDKEIDGILSLYRGPMLLGAPIDSWSVQGSYTQSE